MADRNHLCPSGCSRGDRAELIRMFDMLLGLCTFGQFDEQLPMVPDLEDRVPLSHLDHAPGHWRRTSRTIQYTHIGATPQANRFALFRGKGLPSNAESKRGNTDR